MSPSTRAQRLARLRAAADAGHPALALELAKPYLAQHPDDPEALVHFGLALQLLARFEEARGAYERALAAAPPLRHPAIFQHLGLLSQETGDAPGAERWFRRCVDEAPEDAAPWVLLGLLAMARGRPVDAEACFRRGTACPEGPVGEAHRGIGVALRAQERYVEALEPLRTALRYDPADTAAQDALVDLEEILFNFPPG